MATNIPTLEANKELPKPNLSERPSLDDIDLVGQLRRLYEQAKRFRQPYIYQWRKNYRVFRNRTWSGLRSEWAPSPEIPEMYPIVASRVGWMTDQRPEVQIIPAIQPHNSLFEFYSGIGWDLQTCIDAIWHVYGFENEVAKCLWDGDLYGTGFLKTIWDDSLDNGLGNPKMTRVDPFTLYVDPNATSFDDANYIIEARQMSLQELDRRWPGSAKLFASGGGNAQENVDTSPKNPYNNSPQGPPLANPGAISPNTSNTYGLPGQSRISATDAMITDRGVTVYECWIREHTLTEKDEDGDQDVADGWRVIIRVGNHVLMNESAFDLWEHGRHPYSRYVPIDNGEFYGQSLVELMIPSQLAINRILSSLQMNIELAGNPILVESARAGTSRKMITNRPGQRITSNDPQGFNWMDPPQVSQLSLPVIQFYINEMERLAGMSSMMRGQMPEKPAATDTLDNIQDASFVRIRVALRNLEYVLREQGEIQASLITEFYDTPRMVAAVGKNGENSSLVLKAKHFYVPMNDESVPLKFSLLVNAGSQNATSAFARRQDALTLFTTGALDAQALLEEFNWPNREEIIKRLQAAAAAGALDPPGARKRAKRQQ